jgi:GT2 family glycosyltransferase
MTGIELRRSETPRASIIIPATSSSDLLLACLRSLARHVPCGLPYETIVVLNRVTPDQQRQLRDTVTGLQVVCPAVNLGLAGAANRGRQLARGEFLVLLHDDAEVESSWLETLVETAEAHPEAGAIGGMALYPDGRLQYAGMILWRDGRSSPPWTGETPAPAAFDRLRAVDFTGTSSVLVRASAWDAIGGLDERFYPVYYVDVDLAMALRRIGFAVLYEPRSRIRHHRSASTNHRFRSFLIERNRRLFIQKWGEALEQHEPFVEGSAEAVERALARAAAFAPGHIAVVGRPPKRQAFDPDLQERRLIKTKRALQRAYDTYRTAAAARSLLTKAGLDRESAFYAVARRWAIRIVDRIAHAHPRSR